MKQSEETMKTMTVFHFNEDLFPDAYIEYMDIKSPKVKSSPAISGKTVFKWEGLIMHHISVGGNKVDYLLHDGIVICSFPLGKDRNEVYEFLERYWEKRIHPFLKYIKTRRENEPSKHEEEA